MLEEKDFECIEDISSYYVWHKYFGEKYTIRIWGGPLAASKPKEKHCIDKYTHVEIGLFSYKKDRNDHLGEYLYDETITKLGITWINNKYAESRSTNEPVTNVEKIINILQQAIGDNPQDFTSITMIRNEKPCKHCGRPNDVGVAECWHCCVPNPVVEV